MDKILYYLARAVIGFIQALPLTWVARLGRAGGALVYALDARHRRVALRNLTMCFGQFAPGYKSATTYRGLRQPSLNRLLQDLRERSGCKFFERRFEGAALRTFMNQPGVILGLLADQHAGHAGVRLPFLGHDCSTSTAPAVFALRYHCGLLTGICYRVGLARWRIEAGAEIPTHEHGQPRCPEAITRDMNLAFEAAVRRDPANWFWVHNRWKMGKVREPKSAGQSPKSKVQSPKSAGNDPAEQSANLAPGQAGERA
jgi:lauroyl/myristoyl acyltransferase